MIKLPERERGSYIFRLAGRDRQKSASYYTPECLTRCVVKYSLKELLKDKKADDILGFTICEPAMGSGAFLNEALNQLADAYLERKQEETSCEVSPSEYDLECQKVKAYLATHNCYGVDLNPVAVELAQVSIWLNTIYRGSRCPWFDLRLATGNSLIGARRLVFEAGDLTRGNKKTDPNWLGLVPESVPIGPEWKDRPRDSVYHFLVPADGMAAFDKDKVIKDLAPDDVKRIKDWRKELGKPFDSSDVKKLIELSDRIDELWKLVIEERRRASRETEQPIDVWGQESSNGNRAKTITDMRRVAETFERTYTAYRRLKLVMDYWCALWFWPIEESDKLPTRDVFIMDLELILEGTVTAKLEDGVIPGILPGEEISEEHRQLIDQHGVVDVDDLCEKVSRLKIVKEVAERIRFHHWELRFAEVFADRGGFDLILGNPPWVKVEWNEGGILSDMEPLLDLRNVSASQIAKQRDELLEIHERLKPYLEEFVEQTGGKNYLNAEVNYPLLKRVQTNLYKSFVNKAWNISSGTGVAGFLHPEGIFDDPKGGTFRSEAYLRLRGHFQFINELSLFPEVHHLVKYSVNIYSGCPNKESRFFHLSNLFHPVTVDDSVNHDGNGKVPGIKDEANNWDLRPHSSRIVRVNSKNLTVFARLYDEPGTPATQARLPVVHSEEIVRVLEKFAQQPRRLGDLKGEYFATEMWHETNSQKDGTIRRETRYPKDASEWILSGPHFYVGTPLNKTPNEGCSNNLDYSRIDLTAIPEDYLPRTNYVPACSPEEYRKRTPHWNGRPVTEFYRHVHREMVGPTAERTLIPAIIPPIAGHVNTSFAVVFEDISKLLIYNGLANSIVLDFFIKTTGMGHVNTNLASALPSPLLGDDLSTLIRIRVGRLNCLTKCYAQLWNEGISNNDHLIDLTTSTDPRHCSSLDLNKKWDATIAFRVDISRRQALLELDALAALALDLTEDELLTIYRVQFPVLRQYERENRYDQTGRLVQRDVLKIAEQQNIDINEPINLAKYKGAPELVGEIDTHGLGITSGIRWTDPKMEPRRERIYPPPFTRCDREADMRQAYRVFKERLQKEEASK